MYNRTIPDTQTYRIYFIVLLIAYDSDCISSIVHEGVQGCGCPERSEGNNRSGARWAHLSETVKVDYVVLDEANKGLILAHVLVRYIVLLFNKKEQSPSGGCSFFCSLNLWTRSYRALVAKNLLFGAPANFNLSIVFPPKEHTTCAPHVRWEYDLRGNGMNANSIFFILLANWYTKQRHVRGEDAV